MTMASNISEEPEIVINVEQQEEKEHTINIGVEQAHPEDTYTPIVATVDDPEININDSDNTDEHQQNDEEDPSPNKVQEYCNSMKKCLNSERFGKIISAINTALGAIAWCCLVYFIMYLSQFQEADDQELKVNTPIGIVIVPSVCLGLTTLTSFGMSRSTTKQSLPWTSDWYRASLYYLVTFLLSLVSVVVFYVHVPSPGVTILLVLVLVPCALVSAWYLGWFMLALVYLVLSSLKRLANSICNRLST